MEEERRLGRDRIFLTFLFFFFFFLFFYRYVYKRICVSKKQRFLPIRLHASWVNLRDWLQTGSKNSFFSSTFGRSRARWSRVAIVLKN